MNPRTDQLIAHPTYGEGGLSIKCSVKSEHTNNSICHVQWSVCDYWCSKVTALKRPLARFGHRKLTKAVHGSSANDCVCKLPNHCMPQKQLKFQTKSCMPFLMRRPHILPENQGHMHKCHYIWCTACNITHFGTTSVNHPIQNTQNCHYKCATQQERKRKKRLGLWCKRDAVPQLQYRRRQGMNVTCRC